MRFIPRTFHLACTLLLAALAAPLHAADAGRILIVVSGEGRDHGKARPGYEFDELSQAWLIFKANGFAIDVASPRGGAVEADPYNPKEPFNAALLADTQAMRMLAATRSTREVKAADYAAIYVVGGKGAMFDLPRDAALASLLGDAYGRGAVIGAVCHGPAALAEVRLGDGTPLVQGKAVTGFSNEEEAVFGKRWAEEFPWLLEDRLRARGAHWQEAPLMMAKVVVDGRLVTGQNPYSTPGVAEAILRAMGRTPVARTPWRDELTMGLAAQARAGDAGAAAAALATDGARYHVDLLGMLGYYQAQTAADDQDLRHALRLMQLAMPYMAQPELKLGAARAHLRLGEREQARSLLRQVLAGKPDMAEAKALLQRIDG
ncbi:DJ-1/PfpI family protein [Pseudoxanthomonas sp. F37]|uniref:DJ-1/PfpI family protein n=1 Tax=Pseudoxanthomonas TaxID=83618 RepID=UPI001FD48355|nr:MULTISPECIES: DJ-1/PfpI family protein [Pseudoxanthomonas]UOV04404.1 DJ-1/PfpI family protein [Pseudoxanthomonas mexicana]UOV09405.1 DJ-1/PfpI family protein [Pseudoxanthomonas sp. F37]